MEFTKQEQDAIRRFQQDYNNAKKRGDEAAMRKAHEKADAVRGFSTTTTKQDGKYVQTPTASLWKNVAKPQEPQFTPAPLSLDEDTLRKTFRAAEAAGITPNNVNAKPFSEPAKIDDFYDKRATFGAGGMGPIKTPLNINTIPQEKMDNTVRNTILSKAASESQSMQFSAPGGMGPMLNPILSDPTTPNVVLQAREDAKGALPLINPQDILTNGLIPTQEPTIPMMGAFNPNDPYQVAMRDPDKEKGFISKNLKAGAANTGRFVVSTLDMFLPSELIYKKYDPFEDLFNSYRKHTEVDLAKGQATFTTKGREIGGQLIQGTVQALPSALLAFVSGGASIAGTALGTGVQATSKIGKVGAALQQATKELGQNPMFWTSFLQITGPTYDREIENGANPIKASASAMLNGILGSAIEVSGGLETFMRSEKGWARLLRSALEEGTEEVKQYSVENIINKSIGGNNAKMFSLDPNQAAIINPLAQLEQGAYGAAIGGILGGGQQAAAVAADKIASREKTVKIPVIQPNGKIKYQTAPATDSRTKDGKIFGMVGLKEEYTADNVANMNEVVLGVFTDTMGTLEEVSASDSAPDTDTMSTLQQHGEVLKNAIDNGLVVESAKPFYREAVRRIEELGKAPETTVETAPEVAQPVEQPVAAVQPPRTPTQEPVIASQSEETAKQEYGDEQGERTPLSDIVDAINKEQTDTTIPEMRPTEMSVAVTEMSSPSEPVIGTATGEVLQPTATTQSETAPQDMTEQEEADTDEYAETDNDEFDSTLDSGTLDKNSLSRKNGDVFDTTVYGRVTIVDDTDGSMLTLRTEGGADVTIGRNAFENIIKDTPSEAVTPSQTKEKAEVEESVDRVNISNVAGAKVDDADIESEDIIDTIDADTISALSPEQIDTLANKIDEILSQEAQNEQEGSVSDLETAITEAEALVSQTENGTATEEQISEQLNKIDDVLKEYKLPSEILPSKSAPAHELGYVAAHTELKKELTKFSKALAETLGYEHDTDNKGKVQYANVGFKEGGMILWKPGTDYGIYINIRYEQEPLGKEYNYNSSLKMQGLITPPVLYRVTTKDKKYGGLGNNFLDPKDGVLTVSEIAPLIKSLVDREVSRQNRKNEQPKKQATVEKPTEPKKPIENSENKVDNKTTEEKTSPKQKIADAITEKLNKRESFSSQDLFDIADKAFGGTQAQGVYDVKTAYDSMELGVNKYLLEHAEEFIAETPEQAEKNIEKLEELLTLLPTQGSKRNETMEKYQQFSTPPTIAYLADYVANVSKDDVILEPSAGIGGLVTLPKGWGAKVYVNELEKGRFDTIQQMPFDGFFNENAEQINNILPDSIKPTLIIMNPPFSTSATRFGDKRNTNFATRHIEQALLKLEDNGRLVAIVGRGMSEDAPPFKDWWAELKGKYNIRANVRIDGRNYKKYGTTFDIQMVVIDKTGATKTETLTGEYATLPDALNVLEGIRNERAKFNQVPEHETAVTDGKIPAGQPGRDGSVSGTGVGKGNIDIPDNNKQPGSDSKVSDTKGGRGITTDTSGQETIPDNDGIDGGIKDGGKTQGNKGQQGKAGTVADTDRGKLGRKPNEQLETTEKNSTKNEIIETEDDVYNVYRSKKLRIKDAIPHPTDLVESAAMSAVDAPEITYVPVLDKKLIENGKLSDAQLESISYAGQIHQNILPDGKRRGFFIGDGTGVGKGRELAGIIIDNFNQGRKKAVWVSKNFDLIKDAIRDLTDLGYPKDMIHDARKFKAEDDLSGLDGVLFIGYDTLKGGSRKNPKMTRLSQVEGFFGKNYDGPLLFDESHNMGSATDRGTGLNKKKASGKALAGIDIQEMLPNARVVYASATGATEVDNLAYLTRLGLWGETTPFQNAKDFISKIGAGGLAAMELVARDMKALGLYAARNLSFKGVEYDTLVHELTPIQERTYDEMCKAWQIVFENVESALDYTNANVNARAKMRAKGQFYNSLQRFYNQVITSMSVPSVIESIKKELADGNSAVIQLVNTNEAAANRSITKVQEEGLSLDDIDMTPSEVLVSYLQTSFPVYEYETYEDDNGNIRSDLVTDSNGEPVINKEAVQKRDELIEHVKQLKVPEGPLEMIINEFGSDAVAEITGRKRRVVEKNGKKTIEKLTDKTRDADEKAFQDGKKRILIFSDAGGTGKSYHASRKIKNQQRRIHYLLQPGWSASNATQGFGRTHRSDQATAPIFRLVTTNVAGQKRFTSTIAKRLDQLGALTKGQRDTGSGIFSAKDNLENTIAKDALQQFYRRLARNSYGLDGEGIFKKLGLYSKLFDQYGSYSDDAVTTRDTSKFLNRILALEVQEQNKVFDAFSDTIDEVFNIALEAGLVDVGTENHISDKIEIAEEITIRTDEKTGAETKYMKIITSNKPTIADFNSLPTLHNNFVGLVRLKDADEIRAVYKTANKTLSSGEVTNTYRLVSPVKEDAGSRYVQSTFDERTESIPKKDWQSEWEGQIEKSPEYIDETMYMLTGVLLPIWNRLPETVTRVRRVMDKAGTVQLLGRIIPANQIDSVLQKFDTNRKREIYTSEQLFEKIMSGNDVILRDSKQRLVKRRVSGENRIEIVGDNIWYYQHTNGIFSERINSQYRYFIPNDINKAKPIIDKIIQGNPVVEVSKNARISDDVQYAKGGMRPVRGPSQNKGKFIGQIFNSTTTNTTLSDGVHNGIPKGYKVKTPIQIKNWIMKNFKVNIYSKNFRRPDNNYAYFRPTHNVIAERYHAAIGPVSHELGHKLDKTHDFKSMVEVKQILKNAPDYYDTLKALGYKDKDMPGEVIADFTFMYLTSPDAAFELGSYAKGINFYETFENTLTKTELAKMRALQRDILAWGAQDGKQKRMATIHHRGNVQRPSFEHMVNLSMRSLIDSFDGAKKFIDAVEFESGNKVDDTDSTYEMMRKTVAAPSIASAILTERLIDLNGMTAGESLMTTIKSHIAQKDLMEFDLYLKDMNALDWMAAGKRVYSPEMDSVDEITAEVLSMEREHPEFIEGANALYDWWREFTKIWLVDSGVMPLDIYNLINEIHPHYVPNFRVMDGINDYGTVGGKPVKRAKGSDRDTYSAVENLILQTGNIVKAGTRNQAAVTLHTLYNNPEFSEVVGLFFDKIPPDLTVQQFDAIDLKRALEDKFFAEEWDKLTQQEKDDFHNLPVKEQILKHAEMSEKQIIDDVIANYITYFTPRSESNDPNTVVAMVNGKPKFYTFANTEGGEHLARAFMSLTPKQLGGTLKMVKALTRGFTGVVTANNPMFAIANHARDIQHGIVMTESDYNALDPRLYLSYFKDLLVSYAQIFTHSRVAKWLGILESETYMLYRANAGMGSKFMPRGDQYNRTVRETYGWKSRHRTTGARNVATSTKNLFAAAVDLISDFNGAIEAAPRLVAFRREFNKGGRTPDAMIKAIHASKEATVDFQRRGTVTANLSTAVPFIGAAVAGIDQFRRITMTKEAWTTNEGRQRLLRAVITQAIPAIMMALIYNDDDDYESLQDYTKDGYWVIFYHDKKGIKRYIRIPKEREISAIFGTMFQRIATNYLNPDLNKEDEVASYLKYLIQTFNVPHEVTGWSIVDAMNNRTWYGGNIVSQRDEALMQPGHYDEIYDDTTSRLAVVLASVLPDAKALGPLNTPKGIEYVLDQLTGGIGDFVLPLTTPATGGTASEVMRRYIGDPVYSNKYSGIAYDILDELAADAESNKRANIEDKKTETWHKAFANTLYGQSEKYVTVSDYWAQIRDNNNNRALDKDERDKLNREARENVNRITEELVRAYNEDKKPKYSFADVAIDPVAKEYGISDKQYSKVIDSIIGKKSEEQKYAIATMSGLDDEQKSYLSETLLNNKSYDEWGPAYASIADKLSVNEISRGADAVRVAESIGSDKYTNSKGNEVSVQPGSKQEKEGLMSASMRKKIAIDETYPNVDKDTLEALYVLHNVSEKVW